MKNYRTSQRFEFQRYKSYNGHWDKEGYNLLPNEVTEFYHYLNELGWSFDKAFERLTNKCINDDSGTAVYRDIRLVVETIKAGE